MPVMVPVLVPVLVPVKLPNIVAQHSSTALVQWLVAVAQSWEMEERDGAVAFHRHQVEVASEVARVAARDWQPVPQPREW